MCTEAGNAGIQQTHERDLLLLGLKSGEELRLEGDELAQKQLGIRNGRNAHIAVFLPIRDSFFALVTPKCLLVLGEQHLHVLQGTQIRHSAAERATVLVESEVIAIAVGGDDSELVVAVAVRGIQRDRLLVERFGFRVGMILGFGVLHFYPIALKIAEVDEDVV